MLRIAVPNKGTLAETAVADARTRRATPTRRDPKELIVTDAAQRRRVLLPASARHRDLRRLRRARRRHHRARPAARLAARPRVEVDELDFGASTFRFAGPDRPLRRRSSDLARRARRDQLRRPRRRVPRRARASTATSCASTARSSPPCGSASRTPSPTSSRPARTLRKQGLEIFGPVILRVRRRAHRRRRRRADGLDDAAAPPAGRHGRPPVRADGLRPARATCSTRRRRSRPGIESPTVSPLRDPEWVAVRVMVPRVETNHVMDAPVRARRARDPGHARSTPRGSDGHGVATPRHPVPRRRRRPRREGRQLPGPARRGRPRRARARATTSRAPTRSPSSTSPPPSRTARPLYDDVHRDRRAGLHPADRRRRRAQRRRRRAAARRAAPTRSA